MASPTPGRPGSAWWSPSPVCRGGDHLIRRAARMATRQAGELIGVHVVRRTAWPDGPGPARGPAAAARARWRVSRGRGRQRLEALAGFARTERATQLVLGASRRSRASELLHGSVVNKVLRYAKGLDVHVISTTATTRTTTGPDERGRPRFAWARRAAPLPLHRRVAGLVVAAVGLPLLTVDATPFRDSLSLTTDLAFLALTVVVAALGGALVGRAGGRRRIALANCSSCVPTDGHHQRS